MMKTIWQKYRCVSDRFLMVPRGYNTMLSTIFLQYCSVLQPFYGVKKHLSIILSGIKCNIDHVYFAKYFGLALFTTFLLGKGAFIAFIICKIAFAKDKLKSLNLLHTVASYYKHKRKVFTLLYFKLVDKYIWCKFKYFISFCDFKWARSRLVGPNISA